MHALTHMHTRTHRHAPRRMPEKRAHIRQRGEVSLVSPLLEL